MANPNEHTLAPLRGLSPQTPQVASDPTCCSADGNYSPAAGDPQYISPRPRAKTTRREGIRFGAWGLVNRLPIILFLTVISICPVFAQIVFIQKLLGDLILIGVYHYSTQSHFRYLLEDKG